MGCDYLNAFVGEGGPFVLARYDDSTDRIHTIAGSTGGLMDGPFSRARFGGPSYVIPATVAVSPDRRFQVRTDPGTGYSVRVLDFEEQMVRTIVPPNAGAQAVVATSKGHALILMRGGELLTFDMATGQKIAETKLKATEGLSLGFGRGLALDEKRNRLYASRTVVSSGEKDKPWHVWYFDLNDGGTFHGVLKGEVCGAGDPRVMYVGPFDNYVGYPEHSIKFGPDDPDYRFLYMRITDTPTFKRLDLERRIVAACSGPAKGAIGGEVKFVEEGTPNPTAAHCEVIWLENGDMVMASVLGRPAPHYRRVK